ncbi:peptide chain release factor N(5)-glutamine methyltransferase [soil metagenome]
MNISLALISASEQLGRAGIDQQRREAASLLAFGISREAAFLIAHPEYELTVEEAARFEDAVRRRAGREPFQLIVGRQEFYGLNFEVESGVLIPRHETELLVERAVEILKNTERPSFFEAGVGTGCISVSILHLIETAKAMAVDISEQALDLARRNAERHGVSGRLCLLKSDLFAIARGKFDIIVSNPPYIPLSDAKGLQPEVVEFDPPEALFAGVDGLDIIRRIVAEAPQFLIPQGYLLLEIGQGQAASVNALLGSDHWASVEILADLQGIPRTLVARAVR